MGKERRFCWGSALVGAAAAATTALVMTAKPRNPTFHLVSIDLTSFKLNFPFVDAETILTVHVTNPNVVSIKYPDTTMSIFYAGSLLGSAPVQAGSQPPRSCQLLRLPARFSGLQLAQHGKKFLSDVGQREMVLDSTVDIRGAAKVMWWNHKFKVHVDSHVIVDPVFLDVIDQENESRLEVFVKS
ncbi:hypothetical protein F511_23048 [Dorcoceras hygrometricum]|uniref:Water stress and hypersensitive response domain-containing protein n=1 Tax=Dorcoceras hygrometricum TaxID=472368 RepID=A0A2Z7AEI2_9LAMI|nr:hypothetical protein F511_23048 [Dorcoceras hygrometricum]